MSDERAALLEAISETISDYRVDELPKPTPEHVNRWVSQFDADKQVSLLRELDHVLESTYFSKSMVSDFLGSLVSNAKLAGADPAQFWADANFLDIQANGNSQKALLRIFDERLYEELGLHVPQCGSDAGPFVYLDDVLFSGRRVRSDLTSWIIEHAPETATVHVIVIGSHALGQWHARERLEREADSAGKEIDLHIWRAVRVENRKAYRMQSEVLWPVELPEDALVQRYAASLARFPFEPRPPGGKLENPIFSSDQARQLLEREFLLAGVRIRAACQNPATSMRPLGFSSFALGFGSMIVTYRNCPNNCPLALWWGDPDAAEGSALAWYPLFRRKTYSHDGE